MWRLDPTYRFGSPLGIYLKGVRLGSGMQACDVEFPGKLMSNYGYCIFLPFGVLLSWMALL